MTRIVKPFDWQNIQTPTLVVVIEAIDQPGYKILLCSSQEYFNVARGMRKLLAVADCELLPGPIGRATIPVVADWGSCVIDLVDPSGTVILACGVKFGAGQVTSWMPRPFVQPASDFRFPLLLASSTVSHTPGQVTCSMPVTATLEELCALEPEPGQATVGAVTFSTPVEFDGMRSLCLPLCIGADEPEFAETLVHARWSSVNPYIVRFRGASAQIPSGFVLMADGMWSDSTLTPFFNDDELRQQPSLFRAHDQVGYLGGAADEREILAANGLDRFPGVPMPICNVGYRNHAHWVLNSLLPAYLAREAVRAGRVCIVVPEYTDYIMATLISIGIPRASILVAPKGFYAFSDMLFPSTLSTHVNRAIPLEAIGMFEMVRQHCQARTRARGPRLVYLTRQGSHAQRKMGNEDELMAALVARGFVCIAPHELTFEQEVSCIADADVIVGQLGAAMMNIAFAPRRAWVVEICTHNYISSDYWVLATTLGQRFVRLLCRAPLPDKLTLTDFSFEIPLDATLASIDQVCQSAAAERS